MSTHIARQELVNRKSFWPPEHMEAMLYNAAYEQGKHTTVKEHSSIRGEIQKSGKAWGNGNHPLQMKESGKKWQPDYSPSSAAMVRMRLYHFMDLKLKKSTPSNSRFLFWKFQLHYCTGYCNAIISPAFALQEYINLSFNYTETSLHWAPKLPTLPTILRINVR